MRLRERQGNRNNLEYTRMNQQITFFFFKPIIRSVSSKTILVTTNQ